MLSYFFSNMWFLTALALICLIAFCFFMKRWSTFSIGLTKDNTLTPEYAQSLDLKNLDGLNVECAVGGIFLFVPLLAHFDFYTMVKKAKLPSSPKLSAFHYIMSMLALKLVGKERLSQINQDAFASLG